jgi:hypothetical protein
MTYHEAFNAFLSMLEKMHPGVHRTLSLPHSVLAAVSKLYSAGNSHPLIDQIAIDNAKLHDQWGLNVEYSDSATPLTQYWLPSRIGKTTIVGTDAVLSVYYIDKTGFVIDDDVLLNLDNLVTQVNNAR